MHKNLEPQSQKSYSLTFQTHF